MSEPAPTADLILHHGQFTTLARGQPTASAVAIRDGRFLAVGADIEVMALASPKTKVVDLKGRRVLQQVRRMRVLRQPVPPAS